MVLQRFVHVLQVNVRSSSMLVKNLHIVLGIDCVTEEVVAW